LYVGGYAKNAIGQFKPISNLKEFGKAEFKMTV
jgi:hypothetical protein